ncbi:hypothetical protein [Anaerosalibacter bizertensis]|uniref:hypothetical protein n=1 Tax=Anaerosalibacter bizertensis TaxID=932217 RepID=UPI0012B287A9|nr:hypothetical protein [Anaerosalibacter bizertensis]
MSKRDRAKKANARKGQIRAKRETEKMIKRIKKTSSDGSLKRSIKENLLLTYYNISGGI